jgi:hypothetical protein
LDGWSIRLSSGLIRYFIHIGNVKRVYKKAPSDEPMGLRKDNRNKTVDKAVYCAA